MTRLRPWGDRGPRIFLSYRRRGDSAGFAARLADHLEAHFGEDRCFRDVDDIETGTDFVRTIEEAIAACRVMVVVIGTDWVAMTDAQGKRRLDNPEDFVRIEVARALRRDIRVIPVLVSGASMPSPEELPDDLEGLWRRQALELTDTRWDYDVAQLVAAIEALGVRAPRLKGRPRLRKGLVALVGVGLFALGLAVSSRLGVGTGTAGAGPESVSTGEPVSQAAGPPVELTGGAARHRDALVDAISAAHEERNFAQESLDTAGLARAFEGPAHELEVGEVARLFEADEVAYNTLLGQRFVDFRVNPTETFAEVDVVESWVTEHRNALTDACIHRIRADDVPRTFHLRRIPNGWVVQDVTGVPDSMPEPVGC